MSTPRPDLDLHLPDMVSAYTEGESAASLSRRFKANIWSILDRLRKAGVEIRTAKTQNECRLDLSPEQVRPFLSLVDGVLLGDGQIDPKGCFRLEQCNDRRGWLEQVTLILKELGGRSRNIHIPPRTRQLEGRIINSKEASLLYTPCYEELKEQRRRWYPKGIKRVPRDLQLTPWALAHWFAGDGTSSPSGALSICTDGFVQEDTEWLAWALGEHLGIHAHAAPTQRPGQFKIHILRREEAVKVKGLIEPLLAECCKYKLRHVRPLLRSGSV